MPHWSHFYLFIFSAFVSYMSLFGVSLSPLFRTCFSLGFREKKKKIEVRPMWHSTLCEHLILPLNATALSDVYGPHVNDENA